MNKPLTNIESLLIELIKIPSISGDQSASVQVIDSVSKYLKQFSLNTNVYDDDGFKILVSTTKTDQPDILFIAHADVVAAGSQAFKPQVSEDRIVGRGAWDMKFAIAAYLSLFSELAKTGKLDKLNIGIAITTDEETRNNNVEYLLSKGIKPKCAVLLDGGNNWNLEASAKGAWSVKLSLTGKSAHGSRPWEGDSATHRLVQLLGELTSFLDNNDQLGATLNITNLESHGPVNQVADNATVCLDIRFKDEADLQRIKLKIGELTKSYKAVLSEMVLIDAVIHDQANHYIKAFNQAVEQVMGLDVNDVVISFGASEAGSLARHGIPTIVTRPKGGGHHSEVEWIDRQSLDLALPILTQFIDNLS